jgi:hypothetical protein
MLRHAFVDLMDKEKNFTVEVFYCVVGLDRKGATRPHLRLRQPVLGRHGRNAKGRIEHELWKEGSKPDADGERERQMSDHRPQTLTVEV